MGKGSFDDFIAELVQKNDLVSVASKYVQLERKGRYYWCRCPFHGEKTPSLCINDIDNFFYCYGCHVGGNIIHFVMRIESLSFNEAVKVLADWAGIEIPSSFSGSGGENIEQAKKRKDRLVSLMTHTAKHYYSNLSLESASSAIEYMRKRQLEGQLAVRFGIGYSNGFNDLANHLKGLGYTEEEMLAAGVVKKKDGRVYDPLANRLIFPIIDIYGKVIAFGGRTLDPKPEFAKYLNTAETELFNKRFTLYAINILKKQRQQGPIPYVIVVEGYMDTISLHKAGFTTAIASMGTALTQEQAKMIKRFCNKVYICYDGDAPGQAATIRGLDILKDNGLDVMVVSLPDGYDPDDVIKVHGKQGYQKLLDEALPLVEFKIKALKNKFDMSSLDGRAKYLNEAIGVLTSLKDSVEREFYVPMVSEISMINANFIKQQIHKKLEGKLGESEIVEKLAGNVITENRAINSGKVEDKQAAQTVVLDNKTKMLIRAEKCVLNSLIHSKPYANFKTDVSYLFTDKRVEILNTILSLKQEFSGVSLIQKVYDSFEGDDCSEVASIVNNGAESAETEENEKKYYYDSLRNLYKNYLEKQRQSLADKCTAEIDKVKQSKLKEELKNIIIKINNIKNNNLEEL